MYVCMKLWMYSLVRNVNPRFVMAVASFMLISVLCHELLGERFHKFERVSLGQALTRQLDLGFAWTRDSLQEEAVSLM